MSNTNIFQFIRTQIPVEFIGSDTDFRPCASLRHFAMDLLPQEDAILYIDTDLIFVASPSEFWDKFQHFDDKQLATAAEYIPGPRESCVRLYIMKMNNISCLCSITLHQVNKRLFLRN